MKPWTENPDFPVADWQAEVAAGETRLGYAEWCGSGDYPLKLQGWSHGHRLATEYRAIVVDDLVVVEVCRLRQWKWVGSWRIPAILTSDSDKLYIDYGQGWSVSGMAEVREYLLKLNKETFDGKGNRQAE